jgi:predicted lipid-binding transport protein (Tim44 family)
MMRHRWLIVLAAIATVLTFVAVDYADARAGRGFSSGSRGFRTFAAPPVTRTAPTAAQPIQRSTTQAPRTGAAGTATRPGLLGGGLFGGGLLGGMAAGFLGAGLFGMLFGHGFLGGMGGFASILGLILQIGLVIIVARLAFAWWQRRNGQAPAYAMQGAAPNPSTAGPASGGTAFGGLGGMFGGTQSAGEPITIEKADYDAFERLLTDVQAAYSAEDQTALSGKVTSEMASYFAEQQDEYASRGLVNHVTGVKLLQGDLAEAWREGDTEYATVAMNFALTDSVAERASGRTVDGGSPSEVTELWTFMRARGGNWLLSAIQQA